MTSEGLAEAIFQEMNSVYDIPPEGNEQTLQYLKTFAAGIVKYLQSNAEVLPGSFANSAGNVIGVGKIS